MSHSIEATDRQQVDATDRQILNGDPTFDYSVANGGYNTGSKLTKDQSSDRQDDTLSFEKLNKSSGHF